MKLHTYSKYLLFIFSIGIFCIFFYLNTQTAVIFQSYAFQLSTVFICPFFEYAGGFSELLGIFVSNALRNRWGGALLLTLFYGISFLGCLNVMKLGKSNGNNFLLASILPAAILGLNLSVNHPMSFNIKFIISINILNFLYNTKYKSGLKLVKQIIAFILLWYLVGYLFFLSVAAIWLIYFLKNDGKVYNYLSLALVLLVTFVLGQTLIFSSLGIELEQILNVSYHLPYSSIVFILLFVIVIGIRNFGSVKISSLKLQVVLAILIGVSFSYLSFNKKAYQISNVLSKGYFDNESDLLQLARNEKVASKLVISYTNLALLNQGQLLDKMFQYNQAYGNQGFMPTNQSDCYDSYLNMKFCYAMGFSNETIRWAMEAATVMGYNADILKHLVLANLINENFLAAKKYSIILNNTLFAKNEKRLVNDILLRLKNGENSPLLEDKQNNIPELDYITLTNNDLLNYKWVFADTITNSKAIEGFAAISLLNKKLNYFPYVLKAFKSLGYEKLPIHVQEAACIIYNSNKRMPELYGYHIDEKVLNRSKNYYSLKNQVTQSKNIMNDFMEQFSDTYWFYNDFQ